MEQEIASWKDYKKALSKGSRETLEDLFNEARNYCSASSNAVRPVRFEGTFMAIAFAHERRIEDMAREVEKMRLETHVRD